MKYTWTCYSANHMFGLTREELRTLRRLDTPRKIQDFLNAIPQNHEPDGDTILSPRRVLRENRAHCIEGAMLAALAFRIGGERPLLLDLTASPSDFDHVIAPFRRHGHWGAVSKTNHAVLRYRDPVYRTIRELALSYFHEYTDDAGKKTLRSFSHPLDLSKHDAKNWMASEEDLWEISEALDALPHSPLVNRKQIASLRTADPIEREAGMLVQWKKER